MNAAEFLKTLRTLRRSHGGGGRSHFTPAQLAKRWKGAYSVGTLANWRCMLDGAGPQFVKAAGRVLYPRKAVEAFEAAKLAEYTR